MIAINPFHVALFLPVGLLLGALYFLLLWYSVRAFVVENSAVRVIRASLLRMSIVVVCFWFIAQQGVAPVLLTLVGFLIGRIAVQCWVRRVRGD